jgi:hypothetical protein
MVGAGSAADFEGAAGGGRLGGGEALELFFEFAENVGGGGEELGFVLIAAAESDIVVGVFEGAGVPIGAHAFVEGRVQFSYRAQRPPCS